MNTWPKMGQIDSTIWNGMERRCFLEQGCAKSEIAEWFSHGKRRQINEAAQRKIVARDYWARGEREF